MEIFTLLETLEDILEKSKTVPFTDKSIVSKNEILDIIKEIRLKLPDELKQAKWIKEERERIIKEAQKDADDIVKEAENRIISMIDEHEITKQANERKNEIITTANDMYREYQNNANAYVDGILKDVEDSMTKLVDALNSVEINLQGRIETIQEERKQLK
ncbi:MAG: ATPase [Clostridia bacterium]|nr:ATPase [Clostridia bacterium]